MALARTEIDALVRGDLPPYCTIEHLARIIWCSGRWEDVLLVMLTAAFDASGNEHNHPALVVAGFVSSAADWKNFSVLWDKRLADENGEDRGDHKCIITHFHTVDFAQSVGEFKGWENQEQRRRKLLADLLDLIKQHAYRKFGCIVVNKAFQECVSDELMERFVANAYVLAGWSCIADVSLWSKREKITNPFEPVFEDGDIGKGKLTDRLISDGYAAPTFRPKKDRFDRRGNLVPKFVPLQASDLLAYETLADFEASRGFSQPRPIRWAASEFDRMPQELNIFEADNLAHLDDLIKQSDDFLLRVLKKA